MIERPGNEKPQNEIRRFEVGMSVDALASAWARQENAPAGSVVFVGTEISGRQRGGVPWTVPYPDGLMMAMVARPLIAPTSEALLWLAVTLAAARAVTSESSKPELRREASVLWPDSVGSIESGAICSTNVGVQLGPDRIEHAILSVRVDLTVAGLGDRERFLSAIIDELNTTLAQLETEPLSLLDDFSDSYPLMGRMVKATLLPRGSARGRVAAIDPSGDLVLESPTGMLERVMPSSLRSVELA